MSLLLAAGVHLHMEQFTLVLFFSTLHYGYLMENVQCTTWIKPINHEVVLLFDVTEVNNKVVMLATKHCIPLPLSTVRIFN